MKVVIPVVISLDGKLTRHDETDVHLWASPEDQKNFGRLVEEYDCIVVGRTTYELMRKDLKLEPGKLRLVVTSQPDKFAADAVPGQLEFTAEQPARLVQMAESRSCRKMLMAGGPGLISDFLATKVVDELHITLEPRLFGTGKNIMAEIPLDIKLKLLESKALNSQGSLLLRYKVLN